MYRSGLSITDLPPPIYQPPPPNSSIDENILNSVLETSLDPSSQEKTREELELEQGRSTLARLRLEMVVKQQAKEENDARLREEERLEELRDSGGDVEGNGEIGESVSRVGVDVAVPSEAPPSFDTVEVSTTTAPSVGSTSTVV